MMTTKPHNPGPLSYGKLLLVLGCLCTLTGLTVFSSQLDLGPFNVWVTLLIASTKASLVLLFFMHLKYEPPLLQRTFIATIFILAIFISFMFWDVAFR
jgi:cytochrome c oxidase subunit 4